MYIRGGSFVFEEINQPIFVADGVDSDSTGLVYVDVGSVTANSGFYAQTLAYGHMYLRAGALSGGLDIRSNSSMTAFTPEGVLTEGTATTFSIEDSTASTSKDTGALVVEGGVGIEGAAISGERMVSGQITITTGTYGSQTVTAANSILLDTSGGNIVINGLANGVAGQRLTLIKTSSANTVTINHNNGGTQPIMLQPGSGFLTMAATEFGGITLICDGSNWYDTTQAGTYTP